ncbi:MAG: hypothetical protein MHPSP_003468, partial [Paramarteilia canceri]
ECLKNGQDIQTRQLDNTIVWKDFKVDDHRNIYKNYDKIPMNIRFTNAINSPSTTHYHYMLKGMENIANQTPDAFYNK